ncbi:MAG: polysaccharide deacetylase family protein [Paludibacteraceae bacterium]
MCIKNQAMIPLKLRIIREHNRLYTFLLGMLSRFGTVGASKVFLFHDLKDTVDEVKSEFSITQQSFERFLLRQIESGFVPMDYSELTAIVLNKEAIKGKFMVTFDDANESVYTKAYPFLKKHHISFIIFITKDLIGKKGFLTKEQIEELSKDELCIVGSHALHHKMFRYLSPKEATREWGESKKYLENWLNREVAIFAFPYGRVVECSRKNRRQIKRTNYAFAFSAVAGTLNQQWFTGRYFLPRINVSEEFVQKNY